LCPIGVWELIGRSQEADDSCPKFESPMSQLRQRRSTARLAARAQNARLKKNPSFATGHSLGRDAKVSRFAAGLCAAISTRTGKLFEVH
jgi:hypothetical protein